MRRREKHDRVRTSACCFGLPDFVTATRDHGPLLILPHGASSAGHSAVPRFRGAPSADVPHGRRSTLRLKAPPAQTCRKLSSAWLRATLPPPLPPLQEALVAFDRRLGGRRAVVSPRMDREAFCRQSNVVVVAGKGGVGKTTVTAALARMAADIGLDVLVVELDDAGGLPVLFGRGRGVRLRRGRALRAARRPERPGRPCSGARDHAGRRALGVPRGARSSSRRKAPRLDGRARRRGDRHPGDSGDPRARQGKAARAVRRRRT